MINSEVLSKTLVQIVSEDGNTKGVKKFMNFVNSRRLNHLLPDVIKFLERLSRQEKETRSINITTAREIDEDTILSIKKYIKAEGEIEHVVDSSIIGGFIAETEDILYDASIRNSLNRLRKQLVN